MPCSFLLSAAAQLPLRGDCTQCFSILSTAAAGSRRRMSLILHALAQMPRQSLPCQGPRKGNVRFFFLSLFFHNQYMQRAGCSLRLLTACGCASSQIHTSERLRLDKDHVASHGSRGLTIKQQGLFADCTPWSPTTAGPGPSHSCKYLFGLVPDTCVVVVWLQVRQGDAFGDAPSGWCLRGVQCQMCTSTYVDGTSMVQKHTLR